MPLQTAIILNLVTMTALSHHPISSHNQTRHSAPMGVFSSHRKRLDAAAETAQRHVLSCSSCTRIESNATISRDPSTPVKPPGAKWTVTKDTPPSSSKLASRPPTPVPDCPPPPLASQPTASNLATLSVVPSTIQPSVPKHSFPSRDVPSHSSSLSPSSDSTIYRIQPTSPLPEKWNNVHDHAMCVLDTCNYSLNAIIKKLRSAFPELAKSPLTQAMIDKRLRVLDQNPEIDYFRTGLDHVNREGTEKARRGKAVSTDTGPSGYDMRIPADPRVSTLTAPTSTIDSSFMSSIRSLPDLPERLVPNRHQSELSVKTTASNASQAGVTTQPFESGFLSHRAPAFEKDVSKS
ncbi:hypothetical protein D6C95_01894 [Aureobasidium pullulans]|nr:hypothetical protein D6C95_01894 [Aureobasidium pullulans]